MVNKYFNQKGVHKNHEVKTIKKSYPVIKKQLEDQVD